jgi:hypothetical protein
MRLLIEAYMHGGEAGARGGLGPISDLNQFRTIQSYSKDFLFIHD